MRNRLLTIGIIIAIMALAILLRGIIPIDNVFVGDETRFIEADAYHHMRLADSLDANFPNDITFDPYLGDDITVNPFMHWLIVLLGRVFGNMDVAGAWIPPVSAALMVIPAFFIGRELFKNKWIGIIAALLFVLIPGETHGRMMLGFTDHHCMEILFSALLLMFIILGLTRSKWYWTGIVPVSILFWLTWSGFPLFAGIMCLLTLIWLGITGKWGWFTLCFAVPAVAAFSLIVISPQTFNSLLLMAQHGFGMVFSIGGAGSSIMEADNMDWSSFWANFNLIGIFGLIGLGIIVRNRSVPVVVFISWTVIILVLMLFQKRFAYYLSLELAVLCAYVCWTMVMKIGTTIRRNRLIVNWSTVGVSVIVIAVFIVVPNVKAQMSPSYPYQITPAWEDCLYWLREHSPEPFTDPDFYYADYNVSYRAASVEKGNIVQVGPDAYRVLSWWDYGHWIIRIGRRPVVCSPAGGQTRLAAEYLLSNGRTSLDSDINLLRVRYIIVDYYMVTGKFYAIPLWAGLKDVKRENTLVYQLFMGQYDRTRFSEVWSSTQTYQGQSQVKVFEVLAW